MRWPWTRAAARVDDHVDLVADQAKASYDDLRTYVGEQLTQVDASLDTLNDHLSKLAERVDDLTPLPRPVVELSLEERQRLQAGWGSANCTFCGNMHGGLCPRVRRVEYAQVGSNFGPMRVWFWREWDPPPDVLTPEDVFGSTAVVPGREQTNG